MISSGKWIDGLCADCSVEDAARRSLDARLRTVIHFLPLAAYLAGQDVEHVHRLRVSTRRAIAALKLYRDWLPYKSRRWLKKRLKKIRRAAGDARDLDVLAARLAQDYGERGAPVVALIAERRATAQPPIVDIAERCRRGDRFVRRVARLLEVIESPSQTNGQPVTFRDWAAEQLARSATPFFAALPDESADAAVLHQFRIRGKVLRYTIELVAPAFERELRETHYPIVEELQECLGRVQDHVTADLYLRRWVKESSDPAMQKLLGGMAEDENHRRDEAIRLFRDWWTAERIDELQRGVTSAEKTTVASEVT
jgi:CHAD domain-containing protein